LSLAQHKQYAEKPQIFLSDKLKKELLLSIVHVGQAVWTQDLMACRRLQAVLEGAY